MGKKEDSGRELGGLGRGEKMSLESLELKGADVEGCEVPRWGIILSTINQEEAGVPGFQLSPLLPSQDDAKHSYLFVPLETELLSGASLWDICRGAEGWLSSI